MIAQIIKFRFKLFSPAGFAAIAFTTLLFFLLMHLAGWRESMSILTGTIPPGQTFAKAHLQGALYLLGYLSSIILAPILLIAATLFSLIENFFCAANRQ
jgi:hypothetical protein